ncbi:MULTISPECIES: polysaccharide biosynthesis protein [unclassified Candidatus Frackibacter]|uniref:polysaccharide biosynthesis protein n=1 Tax=unclassified Candidatus Frackibacter TaxID=2648818 RepID=UPI000890E908|nr:MULTISPECIES: polysaccharide biosynthesis protein [unclassified Candidatus Frackibacter]SDC84656.1 Predicted amino acid dehydrogenase [Candidatus Frackibacter sp. WG11]SEM99108.1 Predicted amino acid dehydrogenase [Candidatus Frackibacter sp. WG12]SFM07031.1 Predicted amino acid dehydrogenase [Candidatus Frackibacter sp. WG13]
MKKFGFIIHPLELNDLARKFPFSSKVPDSILEKIIRYLPQVKASHVTGLSSKGGSEAEGWLVGCTLTAEQMLTMPTKKVLKQIINACKKAERLGARIIGLGAYTSIVGDGGVTIAKNLNVPVTTGNSYTVATAIEAIRLAAKKLELNLQESNLVVIGATGSIGKACTKLLVKEVNNLTLVARNEIKLKEFTDSLKKLNDGQNINYSTDINGVLPKADIVITVSSAIDAIIDAKNLKSGSIVCDVARPRDVAKQVSKNRSDVLVIEGGLVKVPGEVELNFNFGLPPRTVYACMAETMILALEGRYENYTLGKDVSLHKVKEIQALAQKHGFKLAGLRYSEKEVSEERFKQVRQAVSST